MISRYHSSNTFSLGAIQALQTWADNNLIDESTPIENPYLEPVVIPTYDSGESTHFLITDTMLWQDVQDALNNVAYNNYYIEEGNYIHATPSDTNVLTVSRSGTDTNNRMTISLHTTRYADDIHPAQFTSDLHHAIMRLRFDNASFWDVDRLSLISVRLPHLIIASENITLNRLFDHDGYGAVHFRDGCNNNTLQNSRFQEVYDPAGVLDNGQSVTVMLHDYTVDNNNPPNVLNTKIINNEFYQQNDSVKLENKGNQLINFDGTIIDGNTFDATATDVNSAYLENAIDIFSGNVVDTANKIIVSNNVITGNKESVWYVDNSGYNVGLEGIVIHGNPNNVAIYDNIIYNCARAVKVGYNSLGYDDSASFADSIIYNNIFYQCGQLNTTSEGDTHPIFLASMDNVQVDDNYIIDSLYREFYIYSNEGGSTMGGSIVVNPYAGSIVYDKHIDFPYGDAQFIDSMSSTTIESNISWGDYVFTMHSFTNNPVIITLPKILDPNGTIVSPL